MVRKKQLSDFYYFVYYAQVDLVNYWVFVKYCSKHKTKAKFFIENDDSFSEFEKEINKKYFKIFLNEQEALDYYKLKYKESFVFIEKHIMLI
jgi:hypothetical protein